MESDHLQQFLAEIEERICTCGAGHGSGEGHTDWCEWVAEYSCPPAPEAQQEPVAYRIHAPEDDYYGTGADRLQFHPLAQYDLDNGYRQTPLYTRPSELEAENARLRERLAEALKALERFAAVANLIDRETEGMSETDELQLLFHDYLMASWPVSMFRAVRHALEGGE